MIRFKFLLPAILITFLSAPAFAAPKAGFSDAKVVSVHSNVVSQVADDGTHCNQEDLDAYCQEINPSPIMENDIVVKQADGKTFTLTCTTEGNAFDCAPLAADQAVTTKPVANGVEVRYADAANRVHQQLFRVMRSTDVLLVGE